VLFRKFIFLLVLISTHTLASNDVCLYDADNNGEFAGEPEVKECETTYNYLGFEVQTCPNGRVNCNMVAGSPVCPTDPSYTCSQTEPSEPFTCKSIPPRNPIPPELGIEYDYDDEAYIISSPDREPCVRPIIETCLAPVAKPCVPAVIDPDTGLEITPGYCEKPDSCKETATWNPTTKVYDYETVCVVPDPCQLVCVMETVTETVIDPDTGLEVEISTEVETCSMECPDATPCVVDPLTLEGANTCPNDGTTPCTATTKGATSTTCSITPDVTPPPCRLEYDQLDEAYIICDDRRATCQLSGGEYACPFNPSSSACTRPDSGSPYTCYVNEQTCLATAGNTTVTPVNFPSFPTETDGQAMEDDATCAGEIRIFNGEPFSCNQAGVRSRWDNCCNNGNGIVDEALDNYWDGVVTMAEGVADFSGAEFIIDIISIYMAGFPAYQVTEVLTNFGNYLLTPCADDSLTSSMIATGRCVTVGTRCVEKLFGVCLQDKQIECCFASKLARIINQQARPQLSLNFGTPSNPDCRGLSVEEFQSIDFSQIDLSEYIDDIEVKSQATIDSEISTSVADDLLRIQSGG